MADTDTRIFRCQVCDYRANMHTNLTNKHKRYKNCYTAEERQWNKQGKLNLITFYQGQILAKRLGMRVPRTSKDSHKVFYEIGQEPSMAKLVQLLEAATNPLAPNQQENEENVEQEEEVDDHVPKDVLKESNEQDGLEDHEKGDQGILAEEQLEAIQKANAESKEAMRHALALDIVGEDPQGTSNQALSATPPSTQAEEDIQTDEDLPLEEENGQSDGKQKEPGLLPEEEQLNEATGQIVVDLKKRGSRLPEYNENFLKEATKNLSNLVQDVVKEKLDELVSQAVRNEEEAEGQDTPNEMEGTSTALEMPNNEEKEMEMPNNEEKEKDMPNDKDEEGRSPPLKKTRTTGAQILKSVLATKQPETIQLAELQSEEDEDEEEEVEEEEATPLGIGISPVSIPRQERSTMAHLTKEQQEKRLAKANKKTRIVTKEGTATRKLISEEMKTMRQLKGHNSRQLWNSQTRVFGLWKTAREELNKCLITFLIELKNTQHKTVRYIAQLLPAAKKNENFIWEAVDYLQSTIKMLEPEEQNHAVKECIQYLRAQLDVNLKNWEFFSDKIHYNAIELKEGNIPAPAYIINVDSDPVQNLVHKGDAVQNTLTLASFNLEQPPIFDANGKILNKPFEEEKEKLSYIPIGNISDYSFGENEQNEDKEEEGKEKEEFRKKRSSSAPVMDTSTQEPFIIVPKAN